MIGQNQIVIDASDFAKGMSSGPEIADGGFSPETNGVNLIGVLGVLNAPANATDKSTGLSGDLLGWCPTNVSGKNGFLIDDDGYVYSVDTSQALTQAGAALGGTFSAGTTDIANFIDKVYVTSLTDVARINTDLTGGDHDWWSSTQGEGVLTSGVRHPLCIFQDRLWVGDASALHRIVDSTNTDKNVLQLLSHWEITALAVDPASGRMLIAATQGANYSDTIASGNAVFVWDGTSATYLREFAVDGMITAFKPLGGTVFVFYGGNKIGYWNGAGITYLRTLKNVTLAGANLPYKHHVAAIDNTLYVIDGTLVLAYGDVQPGRKVWYYCHKNWVNSNNFGMLCPIGDKKLGLGFASSKFYTFDTASVASTATGSFFSNRYYFPRPVYIRHAVVEFYDSVASGGSAVGALYLLDQNGDSHIYGTSATNQAITNTGSTATRVLTTKQADRKVTSAKFRYDFANSTVAGVRRIIIYYDVAE